MEGNEEYELLEKYKFSTEIAIDETESNISSDSEANGLEIVVSEVDDNYDSNSIRDKRNVRVADDVDGITQMAEEIERQLVAKAAKTNLTARNVKTLIRHVITDEHVMEMHRRRLNKTGNEDYTTFEPKLTRSKAKELGALGQPNIPWPSTPAKTASAEVQALIEEELPEDSSDEEYNPDQDEQSDDDKEGDDDKETDTSIGSDVDSQPSTSATCHNESLSQEAKMDVQYDAEGVFKIPEIPHLPTEEESIGQRTRSKFCLSETALEDIEHAFIPPDITTDMYDCDENVDENWLNFLKGFTLPLPQEINVDDDPEADPEYNFLEEDETELLDKEEFRMDRAVKVSQKELDELMEELSEYANEFANTHSTGNEILSQEAPKKKKSTEIVNPPTVNIPTSSTVHLISVLSEPDLPTMTNDQRQLMKIQLQQHVQLMSQQFLMSYRHPEHHTFTRSCKSNIESLRHLSSGPQSAFNADNLPHALQLVTDCEQLFKDEKLCEEFDEFLAQDIRIGATKTRRIHAYRFHPCLEQLIVKSKALTFPNLLPHMYTRSRVNNRTCRSFFKSEEMLLALGLEQFTSKEFLLSQGKSANRKKSELLQDAISWTRRFLLPARDRNSIVGLIKKYRNPNTEGPLRHYLSTGAAPATIHVISLEFELKAPEEQPVEVLPEIWRKYSKYRKKISSAIKSREPSEPTIKSKPNFPSKTNSITIAQNPNEMQGLINGEFSEFHVGNFVNPGNHLRNPIVNMMPSINLSKRKNSRKGPTKEAAVPVQNPSNVSEEMILPEIMQVNTNVEVENSEIDGQRQSTSHARKMNPRLTKSCTLQSDKSAIQIFTAETDEMIVPEIMDVDTNVEMEIPSNESQKRLPQLRQTTSRLAKMRSAQNIKSMAQVVSGKEVSSSAIKTKGKVAEATKGSDLSSTLSVKGDNEDEIAELMRASTTIKKNPVNRKKAKQARELENIKRMIDSENELNTEERATKFAESYLQKLHSTLESSDSETFKAIIKLFLEYSEKLDHILQTENETELKTDQEKNATTSSERKSRLNDVPGTKDMMAINFYREVCGKLDNYPDLSSDFLLFLNSHQAGMVNKSLEWMMLQRMQEFVQVAQVYFAKQPSRLTKVMQSISQLASAPYTSLKSVHEAISPILKGSPIVMDLFLQVFPQGKPPESLFAPQFFENITCPVGPHDKSKVSALDLPDLYENIELPVSTPQEDPYGGENCKCNCHDAVDSKLKSGNEHCASCGTRFLNGRIYLQTSEGLRPAKITFPGENDEKLENIARVSLKTAEKFVPAPVPHKRRRKSSKNDSSAPEETGAKQTTGFKVSPIKEAATNDENIEKLVTKPKRGPRSPPKAAQPSTSGINKKTNILICKKKRDLRAEKRDTKQDKNSQNSCTESLSNKVQQPEEFTEHSNVEKENFVDDDDRNCGVEKIVAKFTKSSESSDSEGSDCEVIEERLETKPWSRNEDAILLQTIKEEYSEKSFVAISQALETRTVQEVKDRCQMLLELLQKIS